MKEVGPRTEELLERANPTGSPVIESKLSMQTGSGGVLLAENTISGGVHLAENTISGGAHLAESTILGGVHQAHGIKITEANIEIKGLNLVVRARTEGNLQMPGVHQTIQIACAVAKDICPLIVGYILSIKESLVQNAI